MIIKTIHARDEVEEFLAGCEADLRANGWTEKEVFPIKLALEEALVNAIRHGNGDDHQKGVNIEVTLNHKSFHATVSDEGPGFNPDTLPEPLAPENLEQPGGRGVFLIRHYMTEVSFIPPGNKVKMTKVKE